MSAAGYTPKRGDFGCTQISGFAGAAIRAAQWLNGDGYADYEHVFVLISGDTVLEAQPGGAIFAPLAKYDTARIAWYSAPECEAMDIARYAYDMAGTPYSFADYLAIALVRLRLPSKRLRSYVSSSGHMICSQLVDEAYRRAGVALFADGRAPGQVTPAALAALAGGQREGAAHEPGQVAHP